jgi:hypothetical protein
MISSDEYGAAGGGGDAGGATRSKLTSVTRFTANRSYALRAENHTAVSVEFENRSPVCDSSARNLNHSFFSALADLIEATTCQTATPFTFQV